MDKVRAAVIERLKELAAAVSNLGDLLQEGSGSSSQVASFMVKAEATLKWVEKGIKDIEG